MSDLQLLDITIGNAFICAGSHPEVAKLVHIFITVFDKSTSPSVKVEFSTGTIAGLLDRMSAEENNTWIVSDTC